MTQTTSLKLSKKDRQMVDFLKDKCNLDSMGQVFRQALKEKYDKEGGK